MEKVNGSFMEYTLTKEELAELKRKLKPSDGKKPSGVITKKEQAKGSKPRGVKELVDSTR